MSKRSYYPPSEGLATLGTYKGSGDKVGVMVTFEVHVQQLFLPEGFVTLAAGERFFSSVCAAMHYHVPLLETQSDPDRGFQMCTIHFNQPI